jgi:hypothetical protein
MRGKTFSIILKMFATKLMEIKHHRQKSDITEPAELGDKKNY